MVDRAIFDPTSGPPNEAWNTSVSAEDDFSALIASLQAEHIETALTIRLLDQGEALGGLIVGWRSSIRATNEQFRLADGLANLAVIALLSARRVAGHAERSDINATLVEARALAHDLNNDPTFLIGYSELLSFRVTGEESEMVLEIIEAARRILEKSDHMYQLVQVRSSFLPDENRQQPG